MKVIFRAILLLCITVSVSANAVMSEKCSELGVKIVGNYGEKGEFKSPLLRKWSEESGNLFSINLITKEKLSKFSLNFKNDKDTLIDTQFYNLKNNASTKLDLSHMVTELKERPTKLEIRVFNKDGIFFCKEDQSIIEKDEQDGVLKNVK